MKVVTEDDVKARTAVFCIPDGRSLPYDIGTLPRPGRLIADVNDRGPIIPSGTPVNILQAEIVDGEKILVGCRTVEGEEIVCVLSEVEVLNEE